VRGRRQLPGNTGLGVAGTAFVHGLAGIMLFGSATTRRPPPPVYKVQLLAAPEPGAETRKAPDIVKRPAEQPAPSPTAKPLPKSTVSKAAPPPPPDATHREAAPRTTPKTAPLPGEKPSTGSDAATVSTEGIEFPFPEYLQNIVTQVLRRWQRPQQSTPLQSELSFLVHRDGSITDMQFVQRSGNFGFDLEAQGAVEEAGRFKAFGPLPTGWQPDVLYVRFYFSGRSQ